MAGESAGKEGIWAKKGEKAKAARQSGSERKETLKGSQPRDHAQRSGAKVGICDVAGEGEGGGGGGSNVHNTSVGKAQRRARRKPASNETPEPGEELSSNTLLHMLKSNTPKTLRFTKGELLSIAHLPASNVKPPNLSPLIDKDNPGSDLLPRTAGCLAEADEGRRHPSKVQTKAAVLQRNQQEEQGYSPWMTSLSCGAPGICGPVAGMSAPLMGGKSQFDEVMQALAEEDPPKGSQKRSNGASSASSNPGRRVSPFPPLPPEVRAQQDLLQMQAMQAYMQAMHREAAMPDGLNNAWGCNPYFLPCHPYSPWPGTNPWDYGVQTKHAHAETGRGGGTELLLAQSLGPNPPFTEGPATSDEIPFKSMVEEDEAGCTQS